MEKPKKHEHRLVLKKATMQRFIGAFKDDVPAAEKIQIKDEPDDCQSFKIGCATNALLVLTMIHSGIQSEEALIAEGLDRMEAEKKYGPRVFHMPAGKFRDMN